MRRSEIATIWFLRALWSLPAGEQAPSARLHPAQNSAKSPICSLIAAANRLFLNWQPTASLYEGAGDLQSYLRQRECDQFNFQLESGPDITLPPLSSQ